VAANKMSRGNHVLPISVRKNASPNPFFIDAVLDDLPQGELPLMAL